jgi:hypothetical protein
MFASHDGGATWQRETFVSGNNYWCHAIVFHPTRRRVIFATCTEQGAKSGIWRSADGGENWMQLTKGLPAPECFGRTSLATVGEGRRAVELRPISNDAVDGAAVIGNLAMIYAWVGDVDSAMERLMFLAKTPGGPDYGQLKLDPAWDAVRPDPRFAKMLDGLRPTSNRR